jgi:hypothetical protein
MRCLPTLAMGIIPAGQDGFEGDARVVPRLAMQVGPPHLQARFGQVGILSQSRFPLGDGFCFQTHAVVQLTHPQAKLRRPTAIAVRSQQRCLRTVIPGLGQKGFAQA